MYYITPKKAEEREQLVFARAYDPNNYYLGGIQRFDSLDIATARKLMEAGFLNPDDSQNGAPTSKEIISFCSGDDEDIWRLEGYVVSPTRDDCRISIDGVHSVGIPTEARKIEFVRMFRWADEFDIDEYGCSCWYD